MTKSKYTFRYSTACPVELRLLNELNLQPEIQSSQFRDSGLFEQDPEKILN